VPLTCESVLELLAAGVPPSAVVQAIQDSDEPMAESEARCIEESGAPEEVSEAALGDERAMWLREQLSGRPMAVACAGADRAWLVGEAGGSAWLVGWSRKGPDAGGIQRHGGMLRGVDVTPRGEVVAVGTIEPVLPPLAGPGHDDIGHTLIGWWKADGRERWSEVLDIGPRDGAADVVALDERSAVFVGRRDDHAWVGRMERRGRVRNVDVVDGPGTAYGIERHADGGFVVVGVVGAPAEERMWARRYDVEGRPLWTADLGPGTAHGVYRHPAGGWVVGGEAGGRAALIGLSDAGATLWSQAADVGQLTSVVYWADGAMWAAGPALEKGKGFTWELDAQGMPRGPANVDERTLRDADACDGTLWVVGSDSRGPVVVTRK
jgi:hypothetical protein